MSSLRAVTVYCSSSRHVAPAYFDAARELGRALVANGWTLVYGGNNIGMMDTVACAVREAGGRVIGVTPQMMVDAGIADAKCAELVVTATMRERKAQLEARGDAFVALPGGLGTFEELFEILVGRILGYHNKPIVVLNAEGYFDPLIAMIEHGIEQRFIKPNARQAYYVARTVADAIAHLNASQTRPNPASPATAEAARQEPSATE